MTTFAGSSRSNRTASAAAVRRALLAAVLIVAAARGVHATWMLPTFLIIKYDLVSTTARPDGTEYVFRARLWNLGPAIPGARAQLLGDSHAATLLDDTLEFGPIAHLHSAWSTDTAAILRHGRWLDIVSALRWSIQVSVPNQPPVAHAGMDRTARLGDRVVLDGSGSTDPEGAPLSYSWSWTERPAASAAALSDPSAVRPEFTIDVPGRYALSLVVNDGTHPSSPDFVIVSTENTTPVANAGADRTVAVNSIAQLDGSASSDADGDALTFAWLLTDRPAASAAALDNPAAVRPSLPIDAPGTYVLQLVVHDGQTASLPDSVVLRTDNSPPVANAGADQTVGIGQTVTLDGSGSTDVDGDPLTYAWSLVARPVGSVAALQNAATAAPTFVADLPGTYVAQLIVNDGAIDSPPDTVAISTTNSAPIADAGSDQTVVAGQLVALDGNGSSDPDRDALAFHWMLTARPAGSTTSIADPAAPVTSFVADRPGDYVVQLVVNDGQLDSAPDTAVVSTTNSAPVANAGPDRANVPLASVVALDGSASSDADGHPLAYSWSLLSRPAGSTAALTDATTVSPTFTADVVGDYVAQLIVNDGFADSAPDTIRISTANAAPVANAGSDRQVPVAAIVQLDGSASSDPEGMPLTFAWSFDSRPAGSTAAFSDAAATAPTFVADRPGLYVVQLIVTDGVHASAPDLVLVTADAPLVSIDASDASASETGPDTGTFTISRTGDFTSPLLVNLAITGTAINGVDYATLSASVTLAAGAASTTLTVVPIDDADAEPMEQVVIQLAAGQGYVVEGPSIATVTIGDDDTRVSVVATDPVAAENGPDTGVYTLTRQGPFDAALTVSYTVTGTATAGLDYVALPGTVTFPAGSAETTVTVAPIDDALLEGPETVELRLGPGAGYQIGALANATVMIQDDERPAVTLITNDGSASEAGLDTAAFTVSRTGPTTVELVVSFDVAGTATQGVDYQDLGGTVTIPAGASSATVTITPIDDSLVEGAEHGILTLTADSSYAVVTPGIAAVTIADNDLGSVTIQAIDPAASESGRDPATVSVIRTGDTAAPLTVFLAASGTAIDTDYEPIGAFVTIPAGQAGITVTITPRLDNLVEGSEDLTLTVSPNLAYVVGSPASATVTIADDPAIVSVNGDSVAAETGLEPGAFVLTRSGGNLAATMSVSVAIGGTALANRDYVVLSGVVTFPAGQTTVAVAVTPLADNEVEGDETVVLTIGPGTGTVYLVGTPASATVTIADDPVIVNLAVADADASEAGLDPGTVTVSRAGGNVATPLNVFFTKGGTASNGADYQSLGGAVSLVVIPAGQTSAAITIAPVADNLVEGPETAVLTLVANAAYAIGSDPSAAVTIVDDPPVVNVTATDPDAAEAGSDPGVFTFTRSGGNLAATLTVNFTRTGTATNVSDFVTIPSQVTFAAGQPSVTLTIAPIDDAAVEGPETVVVTVAASATVLPGVSATAMVTIADND
jgi:hypothetical protein